MAVIPVNSQQLKQFNELNNTITQVDIVDNTLIYIGAAKPGSANSDSTWLIQRITINGSDIDILFADAVRSFDKIWDDRTTYTYG